MFGLKTMIYSETLHLRSSLLCLKLHLRPAEHADTHLFEVGIATSGGTGQNVHRSSAAERLRHGYMASGLWSMG